MNSLLIDSGLPGGMMGSLMNDLEKSHKSINKWLQKNNKKEISIDNLFTKLLDEVNFIWPILGYPPLVTPYSQYVKNVALVNVLNNIKGKNRWSLIDDNTWDMLLGKSGQLPGKLGDEIISLSKDLNKTFYDGVPHELVENILEIGTTPDSRRASLRRLINSKKIVFSICVVSPLRREIKEKSKALGLAIEKLEKTYGQGTIMKLSDENIVKIPSIPTGSLSLDIALGIGGLPKGRVVEIYGPESSGKTTLSMHCIAEAQKKGGIAAFIDAEHAFDKTYAENLGIDTENLLISQPDNGEQALEITEQLIRSNAIDIIVIDSVAALVPKGEIEGEMGDSMMGLQARLMSQALRKLTGAIHKSGCVCVFINQLRQKIGVMFGNPETTTGGNALKFYSSVRLDIRRIGQIKDSPDSIMGNRTKVKVVKNKVAPPFKVVAVSYTHLTLPTKA